MYYAAMFAYYNSTPCSALRIATDNINTICEMLWCYGIKLFPFIGFLLKNIIINYA